MHIPVLLYDGNGNITQIKKDGVLQARYEYDTLGRLTREDNNALGKSRYYTYDNNGNILSREETAFTTGEHVTGTSTVTAYYYQFGKLHGYGENWNIDYDRVGNPTTYRGNALVWFYGRRLLKYGGNIFDYNAQGDRIRKNMIEYCYDSSGRLLKQSNGLEFFYDTNGLLGVKYGGASYVYRKDVQGNIIAILDSSGNVVVEYVYDAWGNHKVVNANGNVITNQSHIGNRNPFRYRSYYYDTETGLYFLQTRYYDPEVGRFINMDSFYFADPETVNGLNLYAYCGNNPVMGTDPYGCSWNSFWGKVGNAFKKAGNAIKDFFVEDVYGKVIKPAVDWITDTAIPTMVTFFQMAENYYHPENAKPILKNKKSRNQTISMTDLPLQDAPHFDPNAKGWGKNGEYTRYQQVMGIIAGGGFTVGLLGAIVTLLPIPGSKTVGYGMFAGGMVVAMIAMIMSGLGGAA